MGHIQKRGPERYKARYRGPDGKERSYTFKRREAAKRWLDEVESSISRGTWVDPARSAMKLEVWAEQWLPSRSDLRPSSRARLESIVRLHVKPEFGKRPLATIRNGEIRAWVGRLTADGMSAAAVRKSVFALRAMLDALRHEDEDPTGDDNDGVAGIVRFNLGRPAILQPGEPQHVPFALNLDQIPFERPGTYSFVITIDGEELGRLTFRVFGPPAFKAST